MNIKKMKRAIISVSDKSNLKLILPTLKKFKIEKNIFFGNKNKIITNESVLISGNINEEIITIKWIIEKVS